MGGGGRGGGAYYACKVPTLRAQYIYKLVLQLKVDVWAIHNPREFNSSKDKMS